MIQVNLIQMAYYPADSCVIRPLAFLLFFVLGSQWGLSLLINVEQYENIVGMNTDAGIKVCSEEMADAKSFH